MFQTRFALRATVSICILTSFRCGLMIYDLCTQNRTSSLRITVGMSKPDVIAVMGPDGVLGITQPSLAETYRTSTGGVVDIWYYLINAQASDE